MQVIDGSFTVFSLPEDGKEAEAAFLSVLNNPHPTYIEMYGDTLPELYEAIKAADAAGIVVSVMLDHTQACGPTESMLVADLAKSLKNGKITITTAGPDAEKSSQIAHRKRIFDEVTFSVVFGSVNASHDGYYSQTNDMVAFVNEDYVMAALKKFSDRWAWARIHLPNAQVM